MCAWHGHLNSANLQWLSDLSGILYRWQREKFFQVISRGDKTSVTPNDHYSGRTAPLTSKRCILHIYSTNIGTEYFKRGIYCPFFSPLQNAVCFIILTYLVPVLFTFYIQVY